MKMILIEKMEFYKQILDTIEEDPILLDRILWIDEAIFQTNGRVNRRNYVHWSIINSHFVVEQ